MILGRTNRSFAPVWFRPISGLDDEATASAIVEAGRIEPTTIVDASSQPLLWGGLLRGFRGGFLARSARDLERATGEAHAADLVEAHLIETLSSLGRESVEVYCVRVRARMAPETTVGALQALERARSEGMVHAFGILPEDPAAGRELWERHDAFEVALLPQGSGLEGFATQRRCGIVFLGKANANPRLIEVSSGDEVRRSLEAAP